MSKQQGDKKEELIVRSGLKLKKGAGLFKKGAGKKAKATLDPRDIDLTIPKEDGHEEVRRKTPAELAFEKRQQETALKRLTKKASVSHREKVEKFNKQMEELTEFNDIPKVSWTK